jgi:branched-subunit amino acid transport protein AzlD
MQSHYSQLTRSQFFLLSILVCVLGDLSFGYAIYIKFTDLATFQSQFELTLKILGESGVRPEDFPPHFMMELYQLIKHTIITALVLVYLAHALVYWGFSKEKTSAYYYVKMMAWLGPVFAFLFFYTYKGQSPYYTYFIFQMLGYIWVALGMRTFRLPAKS